MSCAQNIKGWIAQLNMFIKYAHMLPHTKIIHGRWKIAHSLLIKHFWEYSSDDFFHYLYLFSFIEYCIWHLIFGKTVLSMKISIYSVKFVPGWCINCESSLWHMIFNSISALKRVVTFRIDKYLFVKIDWFLKQVFFAKKWWRASTQFLFFPTGI